MQPGAEGPLPEVAVEFQATEPSIKAEQERQSILFSTVGEEEEEVTMAGEVEDGVITMELQVEEAVHFYPT